MPSPNNYLQDDGKIWERKFNNSYTPSWHPNLFYYNYSHNNNYTLYDFNKKIPLGDILPCHYYYPLVICGKTQQFGVKTKWQPKEKNAWEQRDCFVVGLPT